MNARLGTRRLASTFRPVPGRPELIGVEIEVAVVDPETGVSRPYEGERGVGALLALIARRWPGVPVSEHGVLLGFRRADGAELMLESGCALEYGSAPAAGLAGLVAQVRADLSRLAELADELGLALLSGAMMPYNGPGHRTWAPKPQIPLMLAFFRAEVGPASLGWAAMSRILSIQTTLDYTGEADRDAKHRMANAVSPLVAALFVNSPVWEGALTGRASERLHIWNGVDDRRVGFLSSALDSPLDVEKYTEALSGLPPIFRKADGSTGPVPPGASFRDLLARGYGDGTFPGEADWAALLSTVWTFVRLRTTLELRIADGPRHTDWPAVPAVWTGLAYDPRSCAEATDLMRGGSVHDLDLLVADVARDGLAARSGGVPVRVLCADLLAIARAGLERRIAAGLDPEDVLAHLAPLEETVATGRTAADRLAAAWPARYAADPAAYVHDHRYR